MSNIFYKTICVCIALVVVAGCTTNGHYRSTDLYHWGDYEKLLYQMYQEPGAATPEIQVDKLTDVIQRAEARGKAIPPGVYLHLGVMFLALGQTDNAKLAFNEEKTRFPESAHLINGFVERAGEQLNIDLGKGQ